MGYSCLAPETSDEVHLFHDLLATIQPDADGLAGLRPRTLVVSTLSSAVPLVLLNVSLGDEGIVTERRCGCPLERVG
jgi:hypothetical protein